MGKFLAVIGMISALVFFISAVMVSPTSAPQQTVQELRYIEAGLGIIVLAIGAAVAQLEELMKWLRSLDERGKAAADKAADIKDAA